MTAVPQLPLHDRVARLLADLGVTADEVAESLRAAGVKGRRMSAFCCPVAVWLYQRTDQPPQSISVTATYVRLFPAGADKPSDTISTPTGARDFVRALDGPAGKPTGLYADLVKGAP